MCLLLYDSNHYALLGGPISDSDEDNIFPRK